MVYVNSAKRPQFRCIFICNNALFICLLVCWKGSLSRSVSAGASGLTVVSKEQTSVDMNGPVVPEKLLKNIQVRQSLTRRGQCVRGERWTLLVLTGEYTHK